MTRVDCTTIMWHFSQVVVVINGVVLYHDLFLPFIFYFQVVNVYNNCGWLDTTCCREGIALLSITFALSLKWWFLFLTRHMDEIVKACNSWNVSSYWRDVSSLFLIFWFESVLSRSITKISQTCFKWPTISEHWCRLTQVVVY